MPSVPRDLETICLKCLEKEPMRRFGTASRRPATWAAWRRADQARPAGLVERTAKWSRRRPAAATLSVVSVAMALTLVGTAVALRDNGLLRRSLVSETAQRGEAERQRARAEEHQLAARRYQYSADIALAWVSWDQVPWPGPSSSSIATAPSGVRTTSVGFEWARPPPDRGGGGSPCAVPARSPPSRSPRTVTPSPLRLHSKTCSGLA